MLAFFGLRVLSFFTYEHPALQSLLVFILLMCFAGIYFKQQEYAWGILLGELLLGGTGHMLELMGISLRSALLVTFLFLWGLHLLYDRERAKAHLVISHFLRYPIAAIALAAIYGAALGVAKGHALAAVWADTVPYLYFLLIIPAYHVYRQEKNHVRLWHVIGAYSVSTALLSAILFFLFSTGMAEIHAPLYTWIRDVEAGKITHIGQQFYRIVFPAHILAPGILLVCAALCMRPHKTRPWLWGLLAATLCILVLNLSRTLFLATAVGFLVLLYRNSWVRWLYTAGVCAVLSIGIFVGAALFASGGTSIGLDIVGLRGGSFLNPSSETSTATRMELLSPIWNQIRSQPLLGHGLGNTLTYTHPDSFEPVSTRHYDWGWLELWAELGLFGILAALWLVCALLIALAGHIRRAAHDVRLDVGMLAAVAAMCVSTVFGPGLFHVLGNLVILGAITLGMQPEHTRHTLSAFFHRLVHRESHD